MFSPGSRTGILAGALLLTGVLGGIHAADDKKADGKKEAEAKTGTVVGIVTAKGENYLELRADGEEKARRYVPEWVGGAPAQGGGPNKDMLKLIREVKLGSRARLEWKFEERARVVKLEVLKAPDAGAEPKKEPREESKKGTVIGTLTAKGENWLEVKADGEEKARRYFLHMGGTKELLQLMKDTPVMSRVRIEWFFLERQRIQKLEVVKATEK